jgi:hypothetical protein
MLGHTLISALPMGLGLHLGVEGITLYQSPLGDSACCLL